MANITMKFNAYFFLLLMSSFPLNAIETDPIKHWVTDSFSVSIPGEYQIIGNKNDNEFVAVMTYKGKKKEETEIIMIKILSADEFDKVIVDTRKKSMDAGYTAEDKNCGIDCKTSKFEFSGKKDGKEFAIILIYTRMPEQAFFIQFGATSLEPKNKLLATSLEQELRSSFKGDWAKVDGNTYRGFFKNGKFIRGKGKQLFPDKSVYRGELNIKKQPHGQGKITYSNGEFIEGKFENNKFLGGRGKILYSSHEKYISYTGKIDKNRNPTQDYGYVYTRAENKRREAERVANNALEEKEMIKNKLADGLSMDQIKRGCYLSSNLSSWREIKCPAKILSMSERLAEEEKKRKAALEKTQKEWERVSKETGRATTSQNYMCWRMETMPAPAFREYKSWATGEECVRIMSSSRTTGGGWNCSSSAPTNYPSCGTNW